MSEKDALMATLTKIFTMGRHMGTIIMAVHSLKTINSNMMDLISNVIINPLTNID